MKLITKKGLKKLRRELKKRETILRKEIADKLDESKGVGDLSENSAYIAALEEYQFNETRINELKELITKLKVAPDRSGDENIDIGDKVDVKDIESEKIRSFTIVGEGEGNPSEGMVSVNSVVGSALVGKSIGDRVKISLHVGEKEFEVVKVY